MSLAWFVAEGDEVGTPYATFEEALAAFLTLCQNSQCATLRMSA